MDAVFTWVDGSDPVHARLRAQHLDPSAPDLDAAPHRYRDGEELRFALRALERHAPWIDRVFLVTSGQRPSWLALDARGLRLVTHEEIFPDAAHLPTFNSCAIEMHLHRIAGLSSRFIYFNDDFFLAALIGPEDFMTRTGQRIYLGPGFVPAAGATHLSMIDGPALAMPPSLREASVYLASLRHVNRLLDGGGEPRPRRFVPHVPCAIETGVWERLIARWPAAIARTSSNRFRTVDDVAFAYAYSHFRLDAQIPGDRVVDWSELTIPFSLPLPGFASLLELVFRARPKFFCLQDEDGHDATKATLARRLLERLFPAPSRFEREA